MRIQSPNAASATTNKASKPTLSSLPDLVRSGEMIASLSTATAEQIVQKIVKLGFSATAINSDSAIAVQIYNYYGPLIEGVIFLVINGDTYLTDGGSLFIIRE